MKTRSGFVLSAVASILMLLSVMPSAFAQDRDDQDPPGRAGRVSYTQGSVSFQPGSQGDWLDAIPNRPLTTGDNLWADRDSRAEVQIGSTSIRLGAETSVTLSDLENDVTQIRLSMGTVFFRVRHLGSDDTVEVDTPNLAFNVTEPGEYRVDVNENGDQTTAIVYHGDAEVTGGGSSYRLGEGQQGTFSGVDQLRYDVGDIGRDDDFSRWCLDRDRRYERVRSAEYVSPEVTGYEDLDEYGRWHYDPNYGNVWSPSGVAYDWAPYRYGHWVYVSPWGWTWVEDEPWGFAPFHYGRWAYTGGGWCWVPGPVAVAPVYSPALVAFVGGGGFHVGVGVGVGWFPLGPGEVYVPWYRTSPRYVQSVNITNTRVTNIQVTNVYNNVTVNHVNNITYVNQRQGRGITVVNQQTFVNAQSVHNNIIRVNDRDIQRAPVTHEVVTNIQPQRQSVYGAARPVRYAPPQQVITRPVVATRQPVMVNRTAPVQGLARPNVAPPPVKTVQAVPRGQAEVLKPGASGASRGMGGNNNPNAGGRPSGPENRNGMPAGGPNRGGNPDVNRSNPEVNRGNPDVNNRPGANVPRPGGPQNQNPNGAMPPQRGESVPRGQNFPTNPNPQNNRGPNAPENNAPVNRPSNPDLSRPNGGPPSNPPDNGRQNRNVPRPPSPGGDNSPGRPTMNSQPDQPNSNMRRQNSPDTRQSVPDNRQSVPETRPNPSEGRPNDRVSPPNDKQSVPPPREQTAPPVREQAPPPQRDTRPEPPSRAPENRPEPPQSRRDATPPPQRDSQPPASHQDKGGSSDRSHGKDKDKDPSKSR